VTCVGVISRVVSRLCKCFVTWHVVNYGNIRDMLGCSIAYSGLG